MIEARGGCADLRVLDLYAGTGALGLEALSRGAARVTFVERRRDALMAIRANVDALGVADAVRLVGRPLEGAGVDLEGPFDLVFADPPYADVQSGAATRALARLFEGDVFAEGALFVLEHAEKTATPEFPGLTVDVTRSYGDTRVAFFRK